MRIGDLSARTGVSVRSLRYYEEQGLLASSRSVGGHRYYSEDGVDRVAYLQRLYAAGLSSQTITSLLPCLESPSAATSDAAYDQLAEERDKLAAHIAGLTRTLESLNELIDANRAHRAASGTGQNRPAIRGTSTPELTSASAANGQLREDRPNSGRIAR
jgi:DNA-binding transcriptional MerR regulator